MTSLLVIQELHNLTNQQLCRPLDFQPPFGQVA
ncbi:MAG: hypothetical protein LBO05_11470 [Deltaproteobacteria bacterium]|nr:hypothetical protein [Deltaproteobacteria bacterium]